jgi:hypothetical protein
VFQIWPGQIVTCLHTNRPGHIWTTFYFLGKIQVLFAQYIEQHIINDEESRRTTAKSPTRDSYRELNSDFPVLQPAAKLL